MVVNINVPKLGSKLWSLGGEQSDRLTIITKHRRLMSCVEVDVLEESSPPVGFPGCIRQAQQFGLGARRSHRVLLSGLPIDWSIEQANDVSLRASSIPGIVCEGRVAGNVEYRIVLLGMSSIFDCNRPRLIEVGDRTISCC